MAFFPLLQRRAEVHLNEFSLIQRYFARPPRRRDVLLGIGDDAAVLAVPPDQRLVVAVDTLIAGVHFPVDTAPGDIAHKALAVNLSDLAAMGARPAWFTLALTLPQADDLWLQGFAADLFSLADRFDIELVGGDTTRGPLAVTIQVMGFAESLLRRDGAAPGQAIMVSGTLGDAALALQRVTRHQAVDETLLQRLNRPEPRLMLGMGLAAVATAAIDISDGLYADLGHLLTASRCGATIDLDALPRSAPFTALAPEPHWSLLGAGDDYELCFTVPQERLPAVAELAAQLGISVTRIGWTETTPGLRCRDAHGEIQTVAGLGYDHFR